MFNYFNPLINENAYNYYIRCVNRFKKLLQYPEHKLFLIFFPNLFDDDIDDYMYKTIINFNNKFLKYTNNYTLLIIFHLPTGENSYTFTYNDNIHFLELHTLSKSNGVEFNNSYDNIYLDNLLTLTYKFNLKNKE